MAEEGESKAGNSKRLLRVDQIFSRRDRQTHYVKTAKSNVKSDRMSKTALVARRIITNKGFVAWTEVDIRSPPLKDLLIELFPETEALELNKSPPMARREVLFHAYDGFKKRLAEETDKDEPDSLVVEDLKIAIQFVDEDYEKEISSMLSLRKESEITYDLLWTLFSPGCLVYTNDNLLEEPQVATFLSGDYYEDDAHKGEYWYALRVRVITHDGSEFGSGDFKLKIKKFQGSRKIQHLKTFPFAMHKRMDEVKSALTKRGKTFAESISATCWDYSGTAVTEDMKVRIDEGQRYKPIKFHATGRIILDPVTYRQRNAWSDLMEPVVNHVKQPETLSESEYLICSHTLLGFSFSQGKWGEFAVSKIKAVEWNADAFNKLVMEESKRDLVHALVRSHRNDAKSFDDIIKGKGQGLVGLLSGPPGVGKTLTAEVISEVTKRPLYSISAGELGTKIWEVEWRLDMIFSMGERWRCLLLIDEADVFLHTRTGPDLTRNALVSIFLRRLEYFQGILILTTNRESTIDPAFDSRIHFKLRYGDLDQTSRRAIWKTFLDNPPSGVLKPEISEDELRNLSAIDLNGRQIKNVTSCAFAITSEKSLSLTMSTLRPILELVTGGGHVSS